MTLRQRLAWSVVGVGLLLATGPVLAHHSFAAEFDATKEVVVKGTITKVERVNPHGWVYIDVKEKDGSLTNWRIETGAPTALARAGVKKSDLPIGEEVTVTGYRAKDGSNLASGSDLTLADGRKLMLAGSGSQLRTTPAR